MTDITADPPLEQPPRIIYCECLSSKKKALECIAKAMSESSVLSIGDILEAMMKRERLGTTNFGHGIAIPHGRLKDCTKPIGVLLIVAQCLCENPDKEPVDVIFGLIIPDQGAENSCEEHTCLLKSISSLADAPEALKILRTEKDAHKLFRWLKTTNPLLAEILT